MRTGYENHYVDPKSRVESIYDVYFDLQESPDRVLSQIPALPDTAHEPKRRSKAQQSRSGHTIERVATSRYRQTPGSYAYCQAIARTALRRMRGARRLPAAWTRGRAGPRAGPALTREAIFGREQSSSS